MKANRRTLRLATEPDQAPEAPADVFAGFVKHMHLQAREGHEAIADLVSAFDRLAHPETIISPAGRRVIDLAYKAFQLSQRAHRARESAYALSMAVGRELEEEAA